MRKAKLEEWIEEQGQKGVVHIQHCWYIHVRYLFSSFSLKRNKFLIILSQGRSELREVYDAIHISNLNPYGISHPKILCPSWLFTLLAKNVHILYMGRSMPNRTGLGLHVFDLHEISRDDRLHWEKMTTQFYLNCSWKIHEHMFYVRKYGEWFFELYFDENVRNRKDSDLRFNF